VTIAVGSDAWGVSRRKADGRVLYRYYLFCEWLASWLPKRAGYAMARVSGVGLFIFCPGLRRTLIANQRRVLPRASRRHVGMSARRASISVAKNYYELFRMPSLSKADLLAYFDGQGLEHLAAAYARGKGVIIVAPHLGSYNLVPAYVSSLGYPTVAVVEHIRDPRLHEYFFRLRANQGVQLLTTGPEDVRHLLRALRDGKVVMMLADRNVGTSSEEVTFFGARAMLPAGPSLIARRTGAALVPAYSYRVGNTHSVAVAVPAMRLPEVVGTPEERRAADTQAVARELEKMIAATPDQWDIMQPVWPRQPLPLAPEMSEAAG
ncbi:MAG: lysophospholipid acyltransferase family protein, partial [Chloroflexota bacterium]|nr:lysophospholipid acyltransferase family protein [Chloroflexota bacterium]